VNDGQDDSWAQTLRRIADEQAKAEAMEITGRGVRRKAAIAANPQVGLMIVASFEERQFDLHP